MWVKKAIEVLEKIGVLDELRRCSHGSRNPYHLENDCLTHTLMVVREAENIDKDRLDLFFAALFHDAGKPLVKQADEEKGMIRFNGHEYASALRFLDYVKLLKEEYELANEDIMRIAIAILWHTDAHKYKLNKILPYSINELVEKLREADDKGRIAIRLNPSDRPELEYPKPPHIENKGPIVLLIGPPGIGKSTYIKQRKHLTPNIFVVSRDEVIEEMKEELGIETYNKAFEVIHSNTELLNELNNRFTEKLKEARRYEGTVIVDMTNMVRKWRRKTLNDVDPKGERYRKAVIFLNSWQNILENNRSRIGKEIPEEVIINMLRRFTMVDPAKEGIHEINYHFSSQIF